MSSVSLLLFVFVSSLVIQNSLAYPNGAPEAACEKREPNHGTRPQSSESPYKLMLNQNGNDGSVEVTLRGQNVEDFKGFLIQAMEVGGDNKPVGYFTYDSSVAKGLKCNNDEDEDTVTHINNDNKNNIVVTWYPGTDDKMEVKFVATVVKSKQVYWTDVESVSEVVNSAQTLKATTAFVLSLAASMLAAKLA